MLRNYAFGLLLLSCLLSAPDRCRAAAYTVDSLRLEVASTSGFPNSASNTITSVQNPLIVQHQVTNPGYPLSTASASYDFGWSQTSALGRFLIESTLTADGVPANRTLLSASSARIVLSPSVPVTVLVHGEFNFSVPADPMQAVFEFSALGLVTSTYAYNFTHFYDTLNGPTSSTFVIDASFVLPPTESWRLRSTMQVVADSGTLGSLGSGSGYFDIRIIPEPSTLLCIILSTGLAFPRRRNRALCLR